MGSRRNTITSTEQPSSAVLSSLERLRSAVERLDRSAPPEEAWSVAPIHLDRLQAGGYHNAPPEAIAFADSGVDGLHFALWIDDLRQEHEPLVVEVTPTDTPVVTLVAHAIDEFFGRVSDEGFWAHWKPRPLPEGRVARHPTSDGMGAFGPCDSVRTPPRLSMDKLNALDDQGSELSSHIESALNADAPSLALAMIRDAISASVNFPGFAELTARVYETLGRPTFARIAQLRYRTSPWMESMAKKLAWHSSLPPGERSSLSSEALDRRWRTETQEGRAYAQMEREEQARLAARALERHGRKKR